MRRVHFIWSIVLAALLSSVTTAQDAALDDAFTAAAHYEWGSSRTSLRVIEQHVGAATHDHDATLAAEARLIELLEDTDATIAARSFACRQLVLVGGVTSVLPLAALLDDDDLTDIARYALEAIPHPLVDAALLEAQLALADDAGVSNTIARRDARIRALGALGDRAHVRPLLDLAVAGSAVARDALASMRARGVDAELASAAAGSDEETQVTAVRLLGMRGSTAHRDVMRRLAEPDQSARVRCAAFIAQAELAGWQTSDVRSTMLTRALDIADDTVDRRMVLGLMQRLGDVRVLPALERLLDDETIGADAARTILALALAVERTPAAELKRSVVDILDRFPDDDGIHAGALTALDHLERHEGFIGAWEYSGPYTADGASVFETSFDPENGGGDWAAVPVDAIKHPGIVDLNTLMGGSDRCAYARTTLVVDEAMSVRLEFGSDDGLRVWLDGDAIVERDVARGLTPASDVATLDLEPGVHHLLLKITQGGGDWQYCMRIRRADGGAPDGVRARTGEDT